MDKYIIIIIHVSVETDTTVNCWAGVSDLD